ncbi:MAG: PAS domain S-box protein [Candidatus Binatia bacterium]|nr:PAS domain S-box protein [Candidatus Binatia bacterium]
MAASFDEILGSSGANPALLRALADNSFDSILITDASKHGRIVYANRAFKKLTGYEPAEVIGETPRILQGAGTDRKVIARLSEALSSGGRFEGKAVNYKKDGTPFIMHWRVLPIRIGRRIQGWLAIQREAHIG